MSHSACWSSGASDRFETSPGFADGNMVVSTTAGGA
jgi:hypothetical protein